MASKLVHSPILAPSVGPTMCVITNLMRTRPFLTTDLSNMKNTRIKQHPNGFRLISTIKVAEQTSSVVEDDDEETKGSLNCKTAAQVKAELYDILQGNSRTFNNFFLLLQWVYECIWHGIIIADFLNCWKGINRGIFGVPTEKKSEIENLVKLLESQNPTPDPTQNLEKVHKVLVKIFPFFLVLCFSIQVLKWFSYRERAMGAGQPITGVLLMV